MTERVDIALIIEGPSIPALVTKYKMIHETNALKLEDFCKITPESLSYLGAQVLSDGESIVALMKLFSEAKQDVDTSGYMLRVGEKYEDVEYEIFGSSPPFSKIRLIRGIDVDDAFFRSP